MPEVTKRDLANDIWELGKMHNRYIVLVKEGLDLSLPIAKWKLNFQKSGIVTKNKFGKRMTILSGVTYEFSRN